MDAVDRLRRLCVDNPAAADDAEDGWSDALDAHTISLVRISALIAADAPAASMRSAIDGAVTAGVTVSEIVAVLEGLISDVGPPRAVAAAPRIAAALGYDDDLVADSEI
ncbi:carboxymuconolactone decarboxylase family protein [Microbacterium sp. M28]|uniref:carboxymuconolactone decarboxylase family protein n=1 Tax=Microbacterium sp. M28 TaxID=2962064 RepID=UPI0021F3F6FA|nr:carboxymuconolactone decarboxylase family protein [Microbacterium sp. M28]UYO97641.1 carboxymuconolactone decarboxylase family protein [Microbacterium sp. M28]